MQPEHKTTPAIKYLYSPTKGLPGFPTVSRSVKATLKIDSKTYKTCVYNHPCSSLYTTNYNPSHCSCDETN